MTILRSVWVTALLTTAAHGQQASSEWLLQNLPFRLSTEVSNPGPAKVTGLARLSAAQARNIAPGFPGRVCFALVVAPDSRISPRATFVPSQAIDIDGDGTADDFVFAVDLAPGEHRRVDLYFSTALADTVTYPQRVNAKHSYGYNRQVAALESESIGYRTYGGFFLDFMGRPTGRFGLNNDLAGYAGIRRDLGVGRDVFHIGSTLGLGGIFLRRGDRVWQPPMNVPDYAHKPSPDIVPHYRVVSPGPLRAVVEAVLDNWTVDGDMFRLRALYSIDQGTSFVRCRVEARPLRISPDHEYQIGTGLRELPSQSVAITPGQITVTGKQNERDSDIGIGIFFDPAAYAAPAQVRTQDGPNHGIAATRTLKAGESRTLEYAVAGAWSGSGIRDLRGYLVRVGKEVAGQIVLSGLKFETTPNPEKVDAEAQ
jgi:hypothetical protein